MGPKKDGEGIKQELESLPDIVVLLNGFPMLGMLSICWWIGYHDEQEDIDLVFVVLSGFRPQLKIELSIWCGKREGISSVRSPAYAFLEALGL